MQTAVEWLQDKLNNVRPTQICSIETIKEWVEQAKEMEKQQIIKTGLDCGSFIETEDMEQYYTSTYGSKGSEHHIVDTNEMVKKGTLKKRMDKDSWFVVFQSNAYNESDMAYELLKSQEIDIDMYDVYKDGDEVTFEVVNKKWAKITPFLYPFKTTSSQTEISDSTITDQIDGIIFQLPFDDKIKLWKLIEKLVEENRTEISDEEIENEAKQNAFQYYEFIRGAKWYREQLKIRNNKP